MDWAAAESLEKTVLAMWFMQYIFEQFVMLSC